jgi:transposase
MPSFSRLLAAGALSAVGVPSAEAEAARDLSRARDQLRCDLMRSRHRVSKLLLRQGRVYEGGSTWNQVHRRWLAAQRFEHEATELAYLDALAAVDGLTARREVLDERLSRLATTEAFWPTVARLRCFRGIDTLSALALHLEVCDWQRFRRAPQLACWLGLTPALYQSGESRSQGPITKTGSSLARRLLVEAARHYARPPRIGVTLQNRQQGQPDYVLQIAWRAQHRLFRLQGRLRERGKPANVWLPKGRAVRAARQQGAAPRVCRHARPLYGQPRSRPRPFLAARPAGDETVPWGSQPPHIRLLDLRLCVRRLVESRNVV